MAKRKTEKKIRLARPLVFSRKYKNYGMYQLNLSHKIRLNPTYNQEVYFRRASGTSRFVWNWGLAEWNRQYALGLKPSENSLRKEFNSIKYSQFPWLHDIHRDAHARPFSYLANAWKKFWSDIKSGKVARSPRFKKKKGSRDSFYIANDKFRVESDAVILSRIGRINTSETLRFDGKILNATVSRTADRWYISIQVEVAEEISMRSRTSDNIVGVDLGVKYAVTLSTGESISSPNPLKKSLRRLQIRQRTISRKLEASKKHVGLDKKQAIPREEKLSLSNNRAKAQKSLARLHAHIANTRSDFLHKLTTRLCRENQTVVIEDLCVRGMIANHHLARAISDVGFGKFCRQLGYKAARYKTTVLIANRWFPSSKLCSTCGWKYDALTLKEREWTCLACGTIHNRDVNAAINLSKLPVASSARSVGKVTPVRYDNGHQDESGQELGSFSDEFPKKQKYKLTPRVHDEILA